MGFKDVDPLTLQSYTQHSGFRAKWEKFWDHVFETPNDFYVDEEGAIRLRPAVFIPSNGRPVADVPLADTTSENPLSED